MAQGADSIIAYQKGSAWNTAISTNVAFAGLLLNDWTLGNGLGPLVYSNSLSGSGGRSNAIRGLNKLNADVATELRYSGLEHLFAHIMGIGGVPTPVAGDTPAQTHVFQLADSVDGLYDTVAVQKVGPTSGPALPIWEYPSVKWGGFTITFTADGLATMTVPAIASSCHPITHALNNSLTAVTYREKFLNVFGTHIQFLANVATAGALAAPTDQFYPSQIVLTFTRNLDSDYVMDGSGVQPEPYYTDFYSVGLTISFPVYGAGTLQANNTFLTNAFSEIPMKVKILCTSPQFAGVTTHYSWMFEFPNVIIGDVQMPISGPGAIPQTVEMAALSASTAPTGMTGLLKHMRLTNVSKMATDALLTP